MPRGVPLPPEEREAHIKEWRRKYNKEHSEQDKIRLKASHIKRREERLRDAFSLIYPHDQITDELIKQLAPMFSGKHIASFASEIRKLQSIMKLNLPIST